MHCSRQSCGLSGRTVSTARSTSSSVAPPVDTIIGFPNAATCRRSGRVPQVARRDLVGGHVERLEQVGALLVERRGEERDAELARERLELRERRAVELERLAVLAVGRPEAVLVVVGRVVQRAGVERPVVALLDLHRVDAAVGGRAHELVRLLERPLVVVTDLGDHVGRAGVVDPPPVDRQLAHGAIVPPAQEAGSASGRRTKRAIT